MENVDPVHQHCLMCSFRAATEAIANGLSDSRPTSTNNHWTIWSAFCANMASDPLLLSYKDPIPILATFSADYRCGDISANSKNVCSHIVEDAFRSIGQTLAKMGAKDPRINSEGALEIHLKFQ